jgi:hypothetical protein
VRIGLTHRAFVARRTEAPMARTVDARRLRRRPAENALREQLLVPGPREIQHPAAPRARGR